MNDNGVGRVTSPVIEDSSALLLNASGKEGNSGVGNDSLVRLWQRCNPAWQRRVHAQSLRRSRCRSARGHNAVPGPICPYARAPKGFS